MNNPKYAVEKVAPNLSPEAAGVAHGLNLLMLAIAKTNPAVGSLLDEFTSMHAEYLAELRALAQESIEYGQVLQQFSSSAKEIYQRLRSLDAEQTAKLNAVQNESAASSRIH